MRGEVQIPGEVLEVLAGMKVDGTTVRIGQQLDRKLYSKVNTVLEALGGKWSRKVAGHVFHEQDVAERLEGVINTGAFVDLKKHFNFFETPEPFAAVLVEKLNLKPGDRLLEPSAGRGALIRNALYAQPDLQIFYCEADPSNQAHLKTVFPRAVFLGADFLDRGLDFRAYVFDAILMNPPFSGQQDIDHVERAMWLMNCMKSAPIPLVSVMSAGTQFRSNAKAVNFRETVRAIGGRFSENPEGTFAASGTNVRTVTLEVER
jgi:predicted RNA methylase